MLLLGQFLQTKAGRLSVISSSLSAHRDGLSHAISRAAVQSPVIGLDKLTELVECSRANITIFSGKSQTGRIYRIVECGDRTQKKLSQFPERSIFRSLRQPFV